MKRKFNIAFLRLHVLEILVLACAILVTSISLAAYTNQSYKKGVATTNGSKASFSSNYLSQCAIGTTEYTPYTLSFIESATNQTVTADLTVSNTAPDDISVINRNDIVYTLSFQVAGLNGYTPTYASYKVGDAAFNTDGTYTLTGQTLNGGRLNQNKYTLTIPYADLGKISITVTATPTAATASHVNNLMLARVLYTGTYKQGEDTSFNWSAKLTDKTDSNKPQDFHAYNFEISGTSGKGTVTITWDTDYVQIEPYFISDKTVTTSGTRKTVVFNVDSAVKNYYLIQFYRTKADTANNWNAVYSTGAGDTYITFKAEKTA